MKRFLLLMTMGLFLMISCKTTYWVNYTEVSVPEEGTFIFEKITDESIESIAHPNIYKSQYQVHLSFSSNRCLALSPNGQYLYYLAFNNKQCNVYRKDLIQKNIQAQRTFRSGVTGLSISPDGENICFTETSGEYSLMYQTAANAGSIIRQLSSQNVNDSHPYYQPDGSKVFFDRGGAIWSYDLQNNQVANYCRGYQPFPINNEEFLCYRMATNKGEIWRVNYTTGHETVIVSYDERWFVTPSLSPDGQWILMAGNTVPNGNTNEENVDIYVMKIDGTNLTQLTYHKGHDICPIWSADGKYIYFLSQRGTENGVYNIWKMNFNLK